MFTLLIKKTFENRKLMFTTILGVFLASIILFTSMYKIYVSQVVEKKQLENFARGRILQFNRIDPGSYSYTETSERVKGTKFVYTEDVLNNLFSMDAVVGIRLRYMSIEHSYNVKLDGDIVYPRTTLLLGVDVKHDTFDKSLVDVYKDDTPLVAGRLFEADDVNVCLINEIALYGTEYSPETVIGKQVEIDILKDPVTIIGVYKCRYSEFYSKTDVEGYKKEYESGTSKPLTWDAVFSADVYRRISGEEAFNLNAVYLSLDDMEHVPEVSDRLQEVYGLNASGDYFQYLEKIEASAAYSKFLILFASVTLAVCFLALAGTDLINLSRQKFLMIMLNVLGMKRRNLVIMFALESVMYGFTGALFGCLFGQIYTLISGSIHANNLKSLMDTKALLFPIDYSVYLVLGVSVISGIIGLLVCFASVYCKGGMTVEDE